MPSGSPILVVGLGNPGPQYADTRHNIGWRVVDELCGHLHASKARHAHHALISDARLGAHKLLLAKPLTFMNLSGDAVRAIMRFYKLAPDDIVVVYDDLDLEFGRIRVRAGGSSGGHNGMRSIIACLGTDEFARVRVGIGRPQRGSPMNYVLGRWSQEEAAELPVVLASAADAVEAVITQGLVAAMNHFNSR